MRIRPDAGYGNSHIIWPHQELENGDNPAHAHAGPQSLQLETTGDHHTERVGYSPSSKRPAYDNIIAM